MARSSDPVAQHPDAACFYMHLFLRCTQVGGDVALQLVRDGPRVHLRLIGGGQYLGVWRFDQTGKAVGGTL